MAKGPTQKCPALPCPVLPAPVSRFTETDRNGPKVTYENTETDFEEYRNGLKYRLVLSPFTYIGTSCMITAVAVKLK